MKKVDNLLLNSKTGGFAFAAMMTVYLFVNFIGQAVLMIAFPQGGKAFIAICSCFSIISLAVVSFAVMKKSKSNFELFKIKKFNPKHLLSALMLSCGMFLGLGFVNDIFVKLITKLGATVGGTQIPLDNLGLLILFIFLVAILPAVFEEIFFRGVMVSALKNTGTIFTIVGVACCFALYHCSAAQLLYQAVYGAGLTLLAISSGSIIPCMLAHFFNNFAVLVLTYFKVEVDFYHPAVIVLGLILLIVFFFTQILQLKKSGVSKKESGSVAVFWLPFGIFGCLICTAVIIGGLFAV